MTKWRCSICGYALGLVIISGLAVCGMSSNACAGGVSFGFGVNVASPGYVVVPPPAYPPPAAVEELPAPPAAYEQAPVVVDQTPPAVVERTVPVEVYDRPAPVVVERRSSMYYYYPSCRYRSYRVETQREYYMRRGHGWGDDNEY